MSETLLEVILELDRRSSTLNELDTQISHRIRSLEEILRRHVSVRIDERMHGGLLVFGEHDGKWCLHVYTEVDDRCTALLSTTREMRSKVFVEGHVERLLRGATQQLTDQTRRRELALQNAERLLYALEAT